MLRILARQIAPFAAAAARFRFALLDLKAYEHLRLLMKLILRRVFIRLLRIHMICDVCVEV